MVLGDPRGAIGLLSSLGTQVTCWWACIWTHWEVADVCEMLLYKPLCGMYYWCECVRFSTGFLGVFFRKCFQWVPMSEWELIGNGGTSSCGPSERRWGTRAFFAGCYGYLNRQCLLTQRRQTKEGVASAMFLLVVEHWSQGSRWPLWRTEHPLLSAGSYL